MLRIARRICALVLGTVFFVSGMLKLLDPVGASLVVDSYLEFLHLPFLSFASKPLAVGLALLETLCGVSVTAGTLRRITAVAVSVLTVAFTLLSASLLIFNPDMDCGCFGQALHLTHLQTFIKNAVLCVLCAVLFLPVRDYGKPPVRKNVLAGIVAATVLCFTVWSLGGIPMIDFTEFAPGSDLMAARGSAIDQSEERHAIYSKDGREGAFPITHHPDASWTFVREEKFKVDRPDFSPAIPVLPLRDLFSESCDEVAARGDVAVFSVYDPDSMDASGWERLSASAESCMSYGFLPLVVTPGETALPVQLQPFQYLSDRKTLLTLNRSNGGCTCIRDGYIVAKWALRSAPDAGEWEKIAGRTPQEYMLSSSTRPRVMYQALLLYSLFLLII